MTFDEALIYTHTVSAAPAYEDDALLGLWHAAMTIPERSTIIEIGCQYGRSSSLLLQAAREKHHRIIFVDPFIDYEDSAEKWIHAMRPIDYPFILMHMRSEDSAPQIAHMVMFSGVQMIHIDGDHSEKAVETDCIEYLPFLSLGGYACFHDYPNPGLPGVKAGVDHYASDKRHWEFIADFGACHVVKKIG